MADVFVSYAREDKARAEQIVRLLEDYGWDVFWDQETRAGTHWPKVLEDELNAARCLIALWTTNSVASRWVRIESYEALQTEKLVPVLLDDVRAPLEFRQTQTFDLIGWNGDRDDPRLVHLLTDLTALLKVPVGTGANAPRPAKVVVSPTLQRVIHGTATPSEPKPADDAAVVPITARRRWLIAGTVAAVIAMFIVANVIDFAPRSNTNRGENTNKNANTNTNTNTNTSSNTNSNQANKATPTDPQGNGVVPLPSPIPAPTGPTTTTTTIAINPSPDSKTKKSTTAAPVPAQPRSAKCFQINEKAQLGSITAAEQAFLRSKECQ